MVEPVRHRQTKEAATDMFDLQPPRHISTLPRAAVLKTQTRSAHPIGSGSCHKRAFRGSLGYYQVASQIPLTAICHFSSRMVAQSSNRWGTHAVELFKATRFPQIDQRRGSHAIRRT